jgi:peptide/nickel transport system permease protein
MIGYIVRRVAIAALTVLGLSVLVFLSIHLAPGDPAALMAGDQATLEDIQRIRERYSLDRPLPVQYAKWLWSVVQGDFGISIRWRGPVGPDLLSAVRVSVVLSGGALLLAVVLGVPAGVIAAVQRNRLPDLLVMSAATLGMSLPLFWVSLLFILLFALQLGVLPSGGWGTWRQAVLPMVSLSLPSLALIARMTRATMTEILLEDYIRTARSKGLVANRILFRHALSNAFPPVVTVIGLRFGLLVGGAVIVETVFSVPGVGRLIVQAVSHRDFPVVQSGALAVAFMISMIMLVVDVVLSFVDPRVRYT